MWTAAGCGEPAPQQDRPARRAAPADACGTPGAVLPRISRAGQAGPAQPTTAGAWPRAASRPTVACVADLLLFHHAQGLTSGVHAFADELRAAGHTVRTPDLYDGIVLAGLDDGVAHARSIGFQSLLERGVAVAQDLPPDLVYVGMSLGAMPAQQLAMTRPGAAGALLLHGAIPLAEFGGTWPAGVRAQIHVMQDDGWGDVPDAEQIAAAVEEVELHLYPGDAHLFSDRSLDAYDEAAARLMTQRVLAFLGDLDAGRADSYRSTPRP